MHTVLFGSLTMLNSRCFERPANMVLGLITAVTSMLPYLLCNWSCAPCAANYWINIACIPSVSLHVATSSAVFAPAAPQRRPQLSVDREACTQHGTIYAVQVAQHSTAYSTTRCTTCTLIRSHTISHLVAVAGKPCQDGGGTPRAGHRVQAQGFSTKLPRDPR